MTNKAPEYFDMKEYMEANKILDGENERFFVIESPVVGNNLINGTPTELEKTHFLFELTDGDFIEITENPKEKFTLHSKKLLENEVKRKELIKVENNDTVVLETTKSENEIFW